MQCALSLKTFRLAQQLPKYWYPRDNVHYAIRGYRLKPTTPYPKSAKHATYMTLGASSSNFDSWEVSKDTTVSELEINGPKGLRAALATIWHDGNDLLSIGHVTDFEGDLMEPPGVTSKKRKVSDGASPDSDDNESTSVPNQVETPQNTPPRAAPLKSYTVKFSRPLPVPRSPMPTQTSGLPPRLRRKPSAYSRRQADTTTTAAVSLSWGNPIEEGPTPPAEHAEEEPKTMTGNFRERLQSSKMLASHYVGDCVEHRDVHEGTGDLSTLKGLVVGAVVFPNATNPSVDEHRIVMQSSDASSRLLEVGQFGDMPASTPPDAGIHVNTQLWVPDFSPEQTFSRHLVCNEAHFDAVEVYSTLLDKALALHQEQQDEDSFECHPVTGAMLCASLQQDAAPPCEGSTVAPGANGPRASTLINDELRPDHPLEAHIEPEDRGASKALDNVPSDLSDAPTNLKEATRRPD